MGEDPDSTIFVSSDYCAFLLKNSNSVSIKDIRIERHEGSTGRGLYVDNCDNIILDNVTVTGHQLDESVDDFKVGAGVRIEDSQGAIKNCEFYSNQISGEDWRYGAGIYIDNSEFGLYNTVIRDNHIYGNDWSHGAGLYSDSDHILLKNCHILENRIHSQTSWSYGAGIYSNGSLNISNSVISDNIIDYSTGWTEGVAIYSRADLKISNSVIVRNKVIGGSGSIMKLGGFDPANIQIVATTIVDNVSNANTIETDDCHDIHIYSSILYNVGNDEIFVPSFACSAITLEIFFSCLRSTIDDISNELFNVYGSPGVVINDQGYPILSGYSSCIGKGLPIDSLTNDILGAPRGVPDGTQPDIGAVENQVAFSEPFLPYLEFDILYEENCFGEVAISSFQFSDNADIEWDFGDGNFSNEAQPIHNYAEPGTYLISGTVSDSNGTTTVEQEFILEDPVWQAVYDVPSSGYVNTDIQFFDLSTGLTNTSWVFGDGATSTETNPTHQYSQPGIYEIEVYSTDNNTVNCTFASTYTIEIIGSIGVQDFNSTFQIFPNPCIDVINLESSLEAGDLDRLTYTLTDSTGKIVSSGLVDSANMKLDLANMSNGLYLITVRQENISFTKKFLIAR